ncbi:hypothetical protein H4R33_003296 [Dimargaris cristalligena]|uniref:Methylmalonic aciduria and homocystinuria type D protein n=1 Tax=Dimargaris cristalligena TaxID=215637 RepID=A0A4P9ZSG4_9FUNG|nr:hypothetical protein H4R33_003296 [Dimargaris cristalligena]RKP35410.1 hypothetical protein BJ085DRAFT_35289 [Dimargaris cristalligena]|eukprot:RKP35410.1 hypothetical protein BJ085DRAFT_35289 [Dimargaris cristalligena]
MTVAAESCSWSTRSLPKGSSNSPTASLGPCGSTKPSQTTRLPRNQLQAPQTLTFRVPSATRTLPAAAAAVLQNHPWGIQLPQTCGLPAPPPAFPLEYSIHTCSSRFLRELYLTFPHLRPASTSVGKPKSVNGTAADPHTGESNPVLVIPTFQPTCGSLVAVGADVEAEKDQKLINFMHWAYALRDRIRSMGDEYWADFTDPCSGYPVFSPRGPGYYSDVAGCQYLLRYQVLTTNCCNVLVHPHWGTEFYPATFFTTAPAKVVEAAIQHLAAGPCGRG